MLSSWSPFGQLGSFLTGDTLKSHVRSISELSPQGKEDERNYPYAPITHWSKVIYGVLPSSSFRVCGFVRNTEQISAGVPGDGSRDAPGQKAIDK